MRPSFSYLNISMNLLSLGYPSTNLITYIFFLLNIPILLYNRFFLNRSTVPVIIEIETVKEY